jgi:elongation factor G
VPFCIFINKLYKEGTDFYRVVEELKSNIPTDISKRFICITLPIKDNGKLTDVINLLDDKKSIDEVTSYYDKLQEVIAETDDVLCEKYLEEGSLEPSQIKQGLIQAIKERKVYPILCGSALEDIGIDILLDFVTEFLPNTWDKRIEAVNLADNKQVEIKYGDNQPLIVYVFKVVQDPYVGEISYVRVYSGRLKTGEILYNPRIDKKEKVPQICHIQGKNRYEVDSLSCGDIGVLVKFRNAACCDTLTGDTTNKIELKRVEFPDALISFAINPKTKQDQEKISNALSKLAEEDPTFKTYYDHELSQTIISGMGELHLEVILANLTKRFSTEVVIEKPKIPYRETILKKSKGEGKYNVKLEVEVNMGMHY